MDRVLLGSNVAKIDSNCIADGIESKWLMGNAGSAVSGFIKGYYHRQKDKKASGVVICGGGNNGGDGFVAGYRLAKSGMDIKVFHITRPEKYSSDSMHYYRIMKKEYEENIIFLDPEDEEARRRFYRELDKSGFLVDAIFGTGLHSEVRQPVDKLIKDVNDIMSKNRNNKVFSVDIPSGIDSDNGKILGEAIIADYTITFGCKKFGIANHPGAYHAGKVFVADIGIPDKYFGDFENIFEADIKWVSGLIPKRMPWTYKHRNGKLLVIAGSAGLTGAAVMVCQAALRTGSGIVTLACPGGLNDIFEMKLTEAMTCPVGNKSTYFNSECLEGILEIESDFDAVAIGPGISRKSETTEFVKRFLLETKKPVVIDADALTVFHGDMDESLKKRLSEKDAIITPHSGELAGMLGKQKIILEDRLIENIRAAGMFNLVSVLKGASTLITDPDGITYINPTGNHSLATAGTGDILTGIIGSLLSQGVESFESAVCGTFIHGMAAEIMSKKTGMASLIATDLLEGIKEVFIKLERLIY